MESDILWHPMGSLDALDRRLVQALQIDGRAPFSKVGAVLGVSDQTAARRYGRLLSAGVLRVLGLVDPLRIGLTPWFVRVRCTPDAVASIGEALARRTDTRWVNLISGGTEIFCMVQAAAPGGDDALLLEKLPRTPRVVQVSAHAMLHVFFGQDLSLVSRNGALGPDEIRALTPQDAPRRAAEATDPFPLTAGDRHLLELLGADGRAPTAELAAALGRSQAAVRRRLSELRSAGALYFDLDFTMAGGTLLPELRAGMWLEVEPARLAEVGAALAEHREVAFACATTGTTDIYAAVNCPDPAALYRYLTGPVAALPGIRRVETAPIHRTLKGPSPYPAPARRAPAAPHR